MKIQMSNHGPSCSPCWRSLHHYLYENTFGPDQDTPQGIVASGSTLFATLHARIQKVLSEGIHLNSDSFLVDEGREDPNTTKSWLSFKWCFAGGRRWPNNECWIGSFVIFQGFRYRQRLFTYFFFCIYKATQGRHLFLTHLAYIANG